MGNTLVGFSVYILVVNEKVQNRLPEMFYKTIGNLKNFAKSNVSIAVKGFEYII